MNAEAPHTIARIRTQWVDVARGVGIILVVWGHVLRASNLPQLSAWAAAQDRWIYSFHMPLFFILAGLFLPRGIERGRLQFLQGRWWAVIWPYLLWSLISGMIEVALSRFVNSPLAIRDVLAIPVAPIEQYWFLYALLVCQMVCLATYPSKFRLFWFALGGLLALGSIGGSWIGLRAFLYLPFVGIGMVAMSYLQTLSAAPVRDKALVAMAGTASLVVCLWAASAWGTSYPLFLASGFAGSLACIAVAMLIPGAILASLGRASLAVFVLHTLFSAGGRIALKALSIPPTNPLSLASSFAIGVLAPWVIFEVARQRGFARMAGFGS